MSLNPYNAIAILSFCREFIGEDLHHDYIFKAIRDAVDEYEKELGNKLTEEQWQFIHMTNEINQLIGKSPKR